MMANILLTQVDIKFLMYTALLAFAFVVLGGSSVLIRERQVGIVVKRFARKSMTAGRFIALDGEAGLQAATLAPGLHFGYWPWQYRIIKVPVTVVPQGEIALVLAADGAAIPPQHILGKAVNATISRMRGNFWSMAVKRAGRLEC